MTTLLEMLRERLPTMQKRAQEATETFQSTQRTHQVLTQQLQATQAEYATCMQELNSLQILIGAEIKRMAAEQALEKANTGMVELSAVVVATSDASAGLQPPDKDEKPDDGESVETNKTEAIRNMLRAHPGGLTPVEIWRSVKDQIPRRSYVYSVLGRLKDRDQVTWRRGKYFFRATAKSEDLKNQDQNISIQ